MGRKRASQADLVEVSHTCTTHQTGAVVVPGTLNASQTKNLHFVFAFLSLVLNLCSILFVIEVSVGINLGAPQIKTPSTCVI